MSGRLEHSGTADGAEMGSKAARAAALKAREAAEVGSLRGEPYFHSYLPRERTLDVLCAPGEFLVRFSDKSDKSFAVSVMWAGTVRHFKVNRNDRSGTYYIRDDHCFTTIKEVIDTHWRVKLPLVTKAKEEKDGPVRLESPAPRDRWELSPADVTLLAPIGQGAFGEVRAGRYKSQDKSSKKGKKKSAVRDVEVAVKLCKQTSTEAKNNFEKEAMFQLKFRHKNIVETLGVVVAGSPMMIVLEFMSKGSLLSYLKKQKGKLSKARLKAFCVDAASGMEYLARLHCIHRDVAARNCLVSAQEVVKIADFGLAKGVDKYKMLTGKMAVKWMSPESMRNGEFTKKSDVWSFGVLMWEVYSFGADPYPGLRSNDVKVKVIKEKLRMEAPPEMPAPIAQTMLACWALAPRDRPAFSAIHTALEKGQAVGAPSAADAAADVAADHTPPTSERAAERKPSPNV